MNYDITLMRKTSAIPMRAVLPDGLDPREHVGERSARSLRWRQSCSAWLYRLANRIAPCPVRTEHDELFEAIAALLAEPECGFSRLESASHRGC